MTCPNYSFFPDAPRPHTLWNRARMHLNLEEFSDAGMSVAPHLNAITESDWKFWAALLKASPSISIITKEFQKGSGNGCWEVGCAALTRMRRLQDEIGRRLHPLLVGAGQFVEEAAQLFDSFSLVDTTPYMKTIKRQMAYRVSDVTVGWREMSVPKGEPLDGLLEHNFALYAAVVDARVRAARGISVPGVQPELPLPQPSGGSGTLLSR